MNTKLLVNGKLIKGNGDDLGVLDPATDKVIAHVHEASEDQIEKAVQAASKALVSSRKCMITKAGSSVAYTVFALPR